MSQSQYSKRASCLFLILDSIFLPILLLIAIEESTPVMRTAYSILFQTRLLTFDVD